MEAISIAVKRTFFKKGAESWVYETEGYVQGQGQVVNNSKVKMVKRRIGEGIAWTKGNSDFLYL